jgi:predicted TPR repeat methyltransferase
LSGLGEVDVLVSRQFSPRMDAGEPVPGYLYVITKR